jgi:hypothetical protein
VARKPDRVENGDGHVVHVGIDDIAAQDGAQTILGHAQQAVQQLAQVAVARQELAPPVAGHQFQVQRGEGAEPVPHAV